DAGGDGTTTLTCTAGRANIAVSASTLNFVNVAVGQTQPQTVTITNNGSIPNNDPDPGDNPETITVTGTGDQGVIATDPPSPTALDFGGVAQGSSRTLPFTLKNTGTVTITGISATLNNPGLGFQFNPASVPTSLDPTQQVSINVTFAPPEGNIGGSTSITFAGSWTADGLPATPTTAALQLTGQGLTAGYDVSPATRAFGDFRFDARPALTYSITNTAQADLT